MAQLFHTVELVYAQALLDLAEQQGVLDVTLDEIRQLRELVNSDPDIIRLLASRVLSHEQREASYKAAFAGKLSPLVFRFVGVLIAKNRFDEFPEIASAFDFLVNSRHGRLEVQVTTCAPLDGDCEQRITQRLHELTGREIHIQQSLDNSLIGGLKLRVGDELIDGSVATQLRRFKEQLMDSSRENARTRLASLIHE